MGPFLARKAFRIFGGTALGILVPVIYVSLLGLTSTFGPPPPPPTDTPFYGHGGSFLAMIAQMPLVEVLSLSAAFGGPGAFFLTLLCGWLAPPFHRLCGSVARSVLGVVRFAVGARGRAAAASAAGAVSSSRFDVEPATTSAQAQAHGLVGTTALLGGALAFANLPVLGMVAPLEHGVDLRVLLWFTLTGAACGSFIGWRLSCEPDVLRPGDPEPGEAGAW